MPAAKRTTKVSKKPVKMSKGEAQYIRYMTRQASKAIRDAQAAKDAKEKIAAEKEATDVLAKLKRGVTGRNAVIAAALIAIVAGGAAKATGYQVAIPESAVKAFAAFGKTSRSLASGTASTVVAGAKTTHRALKWGLGQLINPSHLRNREAFVNSQLEAARVKHQMVVSVGAVMGVSALGKHAARLAKRAVSKNGNSKKK